MQNEITNIINAAIANGMDDAAEIADEIFENEGVQNFLVEMEMESGIDVSDLPDHIIEESRWEALFTLVAETIGE